MNKNEPKNKDIQFNEWKKIKVKRGLHLKLNFTLNFHKQKYILNSLIKSSI